jgi:2'-5' RNA ligase
MARRLFVAADVAGPVLGRVVSELARVRSLAPGARWSGVETGHLTLAFLGAVAGNRVPAIAATLQAVAAGHRSFTIALGDRGVFGGRRRPRVLWVGVTGDVAALGALRADVAEAVQAVGVPLESRPFHPHLTLARARSPHGDPGLAAAAAALADRRFGEQSVGEFVLYESHLGPAGARHEPLIRCRIGGR